MEAASSSTQRLEFSEAGRKTNRLSPTRACLCLTPLPLCIKGMLAKVKEKLLQTDIWTCLHVNVVRAVSDMRDIHDALSSDFLFDKMNASSILKMVGSFSGHKVH